MMRRILILLTVVVAQAIPAVAESREKDLDRWLDETKSRGRAIKEDLWPEKKDSTEGKTHRTGGLASSSQTDAEYAKALGVKP